MRILQINSVYGYGSTGRIVESIHKSCIEKNIDSYVIFSRLSAINNIEKQVEEDSRVIRFYDDLGMKEHLIKGVLFDKHGLYSNKNTLNIIKKIDEINPDIIHLHNVHGFYLNYEIFFDYLNKLNKKIIWTLHDCWAFTGYCSYFDYNECDKWKSGCNNCKFSNVYPYRVLSNSKNNYIRKNKAFNIDNLTLVTPSFWLKNLLKDSFLNNIKSVVINNSIDLEKFQYTPSNYLKEKYNISEKIALMVASPFTKQKGFDEAIKLSHIINDEWKIVMIGLNDKQVKSLPNNIIGIKRTEDLDELVKCYCSSDIMVNLTLEDNYPTVNLEALACGLPVITYDTGGSTEMIKGKGIVVERKNLKEVYKAMNSISLKKQVHILSKDMVSEYIKLYKNV